MNVVFMLLVSLFSFSDNIKTQEEFSKEYKATRKVQKDRFKVETPEQKSYTLTITNGKSESESSCHNGRFLWNLYCSWEGRFWSQQHQSRASKVIVILNGKKIVKSRDVNKRVDSFSKEVSLRARNTIKVKVLGSKKSRISLKIESAIFNNPPVPQIAFSVSHTDPQTLLFDGSRSTDDGQIVRYDWQFGDGNIGVGANVSHTYLIGGQYEVLLTATDDLGAQATATQLITVEDRAQFAAYRQYPTVSNPR